MKRIFKIEIYAEDEDTPNAGRKVKGRIVANSYDNQGKEEPVSYQGTEDTSVPPDVKKHIDKGNIKGNISGIDRIFIVRHHGSPGCVTTVINGEQRTRCF